MPGSLGFPEIPYRADWQAVCKFGRITRKVYPKCPISPKIKQIPLANPVLEAPIALPQAGSCSSAQGLAMRA